jgi:hypothetical protein
MASPVYTIFKLGRFGCFFFGLLKLKPFSMSASGYGKATHEQIGWYQTVVEASACTVSKGITNL